LDSYSASGDAIGDWALRVFWEITSSLDLPKLYYSYFVLAGQNQLEKRHQQESDAPGKEAAHLAIGKFFSFTSGMRRQEWYK